MKISSLPIFLGLFWVLTSFVSFGIAGENPIAESDSLLTQVWILDPNSVTAGPAGINQISDAKDAIKDFNQHHPHSIKNLHVRVEKDSKIHVYFIGKSLMYWIGLPSIRVVGDRVEMTVRSDFDSESMNNDRSINNRETIWGRLDQEVYDRVTSKLNDIIYSSRSTRTLPPL